MPALDLGTALTTSYSTVSGSVFNVGLIKERVNRYFPSNIREKENVEEFQEGIGNILAGFRNSIENMKSFVDPTKITTDFLDKLGAQFDLEFPKGVTEEKRRLQIRDAIFAYRTAGTERALIRLFRLIGWDVNIDYCWTLSPLGASEIQIYYDGSVIYTEPSNFTYNNTGITPVLPGGIIFGNEFINPGDGKVYLNAYDDFGNTYNDLSIYGETYGNGDTGIMVKLPYIRLTINETDYGDITQEYIDPITGIPYAYTESEEFSIIEETIRFFLDEGRPANVAVLDLVTFSFKEDHILFGAKDTLTEITPEYSGAYDGTWAYGMPIDPYEFDENYDLFLYGDVSLLASPPAAVTDDFEYVSGVSGIQQWVPTRDTCDIYLELPTEAIVEVQWSDSPRTVIAAGGGDWYTHTIVNGIAAGGAWVGSQSTVRALRLNITTPSASTNILLRITNL